MKRNKKIQIRYPTGEVEVYDNLEEAARTQGVTKAAICNVIANGGVLKRSKAEFSYLEEDSEKQSKPKRKKIYRFKKSTTVYEAVGIEECAKIVNKIRVEENLQPVKNNTAQTYAANRIAQGYANWELEVVYE